MKKCKDCHTKLPENARFCSYCGKKQAERSSGQKPFGFDLDGDMEEQIINGFFVALKSRVEEEQDEKLYNQYAEKVYQSGFRDSLQRRAFQLAERIKLKNTKKEAAQGSIFELYDELLDLFIIRHCEKLNIVHLPEAILKYHQIAPSEIHLFQLILDFLDFEREEETVYTDFVQMPIEKLKNAGKFFLFPEKDEKILLICDQSLLGSCKEGFALTESGLYWKAHLHTAKKVLYTESFDLKREKDWLLINGYFFNVNKSLNLKMYKLLKKLSAQI